MQGTDLRKEPSIVQNGMQLGKEERMEVYFQECSHKMEARTEANLEGTKYTKMKSESQQVHCKIPGKVRKQESSKQKS